jgi:predicted transcriptional regulator
MLKENDPRYAPHYSMSLRLKPSTGNLLEDLARKMQINKTAVITTALRELAKREEVPEREETGA